MTRLRFPLLATAFAMVALLTACGGEPITVNTASSVPAWPAPTALPQDLYTCADEPGVPPVKAGKRRQTEGQVSDYIIDLRAAGADCRSKHGVLAADKVATDAAYRAATSKAIPPQ